MWGLEIERWNEKGSGNGFHGLFNRSFYGLFNRSFYGLLNELLHGLFNRSFNGSFYGLLNELTMNRSIHHSLTPSNDPQPHTSLSLLSPRFLSQTKQKLIHAFF